MEENEKKTETAQRKKKTATAATQKKTVRKPKATTPKTLTGKRTNTTRKKKVEPTEPVELADNTLATESTESIQANESVGNTQVHESADNVQTNEQVLTAQATEDTTPVAEATENAKPAEATENVKPAEATEASNPEKPQRPQQELRIPQLPDYHIGNIVDLAQAPQRVIILTDQQIQQLSLEEIEKRHLYLEASLMRVLDYDIVLSDTNVWLELLVGHTSSHSDPRVNARLQFERQLEFISKLMRYRHGRFMMMGETYEEIDRFASLQDPTNHKEADFTDNLVCLNTAARLAKRLILAQQKENRLRIEGIQAESHHASFADPAIIRKVVELFAQGKKVLLLTNDASVAIRSMGMCDDLQRHNNISDDVWDEVYAPLRPMVFTFEDLKVLDYYTRQYYYLHMASALPWMGTVPERMQRNTPEPLMLWEEAFRPGDKRKGDNLNPESITEKNTNNVSGSQKQKQGNQQKQNKQPGQQKQKQKQNNNTQQNAQNTQQNAPVVPVQPSAQVSVSAPASATEPVMPQDTKAEKKSKEAPQTENAPQQEAREKENSVAETSATTESAPQQEEQKNTRSRSRRKPQRSKKSATGNAATQQNTNDTSQPIVEN